RVGNRGAQAIAAQLATTSNPTATVQRLCTECEEEKKGAAHAHRKEASQAAPAATTDVAANIGALPGGGSPLPGATRAFFETRIGADCSQVRVHPDAVAADTAESIQAKAFTVGHDIAFNRGQYAPQSPRGQHLLAHELTHVVQQQGDQVQRDLLD